MCTLQVGKCKAHMFQKNKIFLYLFILCVNLVYSQQVEIIRKSDFKHDYIIGPIEYLEDLKDTARVNYIATLKVESKTFYTGAVIYWLDALQSTSKKLGANAFCLEKFSQKDSIATLVVKVYFAGIKFLKENKLKRNKNNIFLFSTNTNMKADSFYLNKVKNNIDPKKYFLIPATLKQEYNLNVNLAVTTKVKFTKEKPSRYFIIPLTKTVMRPGKVATNPYNKKAMKNAPLVAFSVAGLAGVGIVYIVAFAGGSNSLLEVRYREDRFMSDIYK